MMVPSRGIRTAQGTAARLFQLQCRNLSLATRRVPSAAFCNKVSRTPLSTRRQNAVPSALRTSQSIRHASTTPTSSTEQASSAAEPSSFPNLDTITLDNIDLSTAGDISAVPEKIGYLQEIGLNYGIGPTSGIEWVIEHIHIYSGIPWWASIASTALLLRLVMLPLYLKASDTTARQNALVSITKPITDKMTAAQRSKNQEEVMIAWQQLRAIRARAGIRFRDQFAPVIVQGVIGYCGFKLIRAMATLPVPGLQTEGFLWIQDLTLSDGFLILPALMAASIHMLVRWGGETGSMNQSAINPGMQKFMLYGMPVMVFFITGWQSAAVCIWFASSGALGMAQALMLQQPGIRKYLKLAPLYKPAAGEADKGALGAMLEGSRPKQSTSTSNSPPGSPSITWQAPNLRYSSSPRSQGVIDTTLVKPTPKKSSGPSPEEMVQPGHQDVSGGVLGKASDAWTSLRKRGSDIVKQATTESVEKQQQKKRAAFKKEADAYEQRAQRRAKGR